MIRKLTFVVLCLAVLFIVAYLFQPIKESNGIDKRTKYQLITNWPALPKYLLLGNPTGLDIDSNGNVVVFHRADREWPLFGSMPDQPIRHKTILVIDNESGKLINSWGDDMFIMPHGLTLDYDNNIWVTDVALHQVFKFSQDGMLIMKLGIAKTPGNDSLHFDKPTDVAIAKDGSFYVSDGYGNSRVVKFSASGSYLFEWGTKGVKESEFNIPHGISLDSAGNVYVADRENNRVQVFDGNGKFIKQFVDDSYGTMYAVAFDKSQSKLFAIDDFTFLKLKHRGSDIFVFDVTGKVQTRFGRSGDYRGDVSWYHDVAVDKNENVFVGDILGNTLQKFRKSADNLIEGRSKN